MGTSDSKAVYDAETGLVSIQETVFVYEISKNSLADGVFIEQDVLVDVTINGKTSKITRQYHVIDMMLDVRVGDTVAFTILRDGKKMTVDIVITEECLVEY